MNFSTVLESMKAGGRYRAYRLAWRCGQYVCLQRGYPDGIPINKNTAAATGLPEGSVLRFQPYFIFRSEDGSFVPWVPTHADLLADDWLGAA